MKDSFGRKIDYLRISVTDLCNLRCKYCMPENGVCKKPHEDILSFEEITDIVRAACELGVKKVRLTGGEPLVRRGIVSLVGMIKDVSPDIDLNMTTNAVLLDRYAYDLKNAGLNRVNISLDTLNAEKYKQITRGGNIEDAFRGIEAAKKAGLNPIKINAVLINGFNDDEINDFIGLTIDEDVEVRFIELMPFGANAQEYSDDRFLSNKTVLERAPKLERIGEDESSVCMSYRLSGAKGKVGLISPHSNKFCDRCNRIRITSDAKIKPCLHSNDEIDIREQRQNGISYQEIFRMAILGKPDMHKFEDNVYTSRAMNRIGG